MAKYKYLKISKSKKLRYLDNYFKKKLYVIFLHGFMSDIEGEKPHAFKKYAIKKKLGFLAIEYSGHGKSSGKFTKTNLSRWSDDVKISIKKIVKKNNFVLIGSSMGSWISLIIFKDFIKQIKGLTKQVPAGRLGNVDEIADLVLWLSSSENTFVTGQNIAIDGGFTRV